MARPKKNPSAPITKKPAPPVFKSEAEEAEFWATHDSTEFDLGEEVLVITNIQKPAVVPIKQPRSALAQVESQPSSPSPSEEKSKKASPGFRQTVQTRYDDYPTARKFFDVWTAEHSKEISAGKMRARIRLRKAIGKYDLCMFEWKP